MQGLIQQQVNPAPVELQDPENTSEHRGGKPKKTKSKAGRSRKNEKID